MAYIGALRALKDAGVNITGFAGSSIGSLVASLVTVGYNIDELEDILLNLKMDIFKDINFNFTKDFSFSKGEAFLVWIRDLIESKYYGESYVKDQMPPVCFKHVDTELTVLSVNLTDSSYNEFSCKMTPDTEIAYAVRASVSMPGLFRPLYQGDEVIVDGDLIKSWPLWRVSPDLCPECSRILEFRLEDSPKNRKIESGLSYLNAVYNTISNFATDFIIDLYAERDKFDYIKINSTNVSVLDFILPKEEKKELIDLGYKTTLNYFTNVLPKKRKNLFDNYYEIQLILTKMLHELDKKNDVKSAYCILTELFVHLCDHKRYIDIEIYDKIVAFKNLFNKNYKISKLFFVSGYNLSGKILIVRELEQIINIVRAKTVELKA